MTKIDAEATADETPESATETPAAPGESPVTEINTQETGEHDGNYALPTLVVTQPAQRRSNAGATPPTGGTTHSAASSATSLPQPAPVQPVTTGEPARAGDDWPTGGQTATGPLDGYVATVTATATKTPTPIIETPQGISVVGQQQIQQQGAESIEEALTYTSGVRSEVYGFNPIYGGFLIRGFDVSSFDGIYRNGMKTSGDMQAEPFGVERIEVLKGPASVLYGTAPPGGIVNLVSKRPLFEAHHLVEAELGNFDHVQGALDIGGPVNGPGSTLFYRLTMLGRDSGTQVDFVPNDRFYIAPALTWKPSEDTTFTWLSYYQYDDTSFIVDAPAKGSLLSNPPYGRVPISNNLGIPYWDGRVNNIYSTAYEFEHRFSDLIQINQALAYTGLDVDYKWSFPYEQADPRTLAIYSTNSPYNEDLFTVDTHAVLTWGQGLKHTMLLGTDYRFAKRDDSYSDADSGFIDIYRPRADCCFGPLFHWDDTGSELEQLGLYIQEQAKLGDHLTVLVGGRQDFTDNFNYVNDFSTGTRIRTTSSQKDDAFTWRGGLVYLFDNGVAPYFSYSTSFEPTLGLDRFNQPFDPTTAEQYEAGIKYQPKNMQSFITLSVFDITRANVLTEDPVDPNYQIQTGEVSSQGFEAEGNFDLSSGLSAIATYTYTEAIVTASNDPAEIGTFFEGVPRNMASLWLLYEFQQGWAKGWGVGGGVRYVGETFNRLNTLAIPSYTLVDARLQYQYKGWEFSINGRNIFDETYVSWCGDYDSDPFAFNRCRYGDARTVVARAGYRW